LIKLPLMIASKGFLPLALDRSNEPERLLPVSAIERHLRQAVPQGSVDPNLELHDHRRSPTISF